MEATTPFRRWLRTALPIALVAAGCNSTGKPDSLVPGLDQGRVNAQDQNPNSATAQRASSSGPVARPQAPGEPTGPLVPLSPADLAPVGPPSSLPIPVSPAASSPNAAVQGLPLNPADPTPGTVSPAGGVSSKLVVPNGITRVKIVAVVGAGNYITDQEVIEAVRQRKQDYLSVVDGPNGQSIFRDDAKEKVIYIEELRRTIERELILDEMATRLKKAKKAEVLDQIKEFAGKATDRQLTEYKKNFKVQTDEELQSKVLTPEGLTLPVIRRQIERQMMAEEYVRSMLKERGKSVGLAEMQDYYTKHPEEYRTEDRVKWLHIFVSVSKFPNARAAYDHALAVQQQAAAGGDFVALVKQYDHGVASQQNGEGVGQKHGEIRPVDVEPILWTLQPGQISALIESPTGYHIVKVVERDVAGVKPFNEAVQDDVRRKLLKQLQDKEYKRLVEELWRRGVVKVMAGS